MYKLNKGLLLLSALFTLNINANPVETKQNKPANATSQSNDWQFRLTPYAWFAGFSGDMNISPNGPVIPIDISPKEAINDSEVAFFALFEAKKNNMGLLLDFSYSDSRSDEVLIEANKLTLTSVSKTTVLSAAFLYELYNENNTIIDVFAGVRYWDLDPSMTFKGGSGALEGTTIHNSESWVDPVIGVKANTQLGNSNFYLAGGIAYGGFNIGSEYFYDISANIGYQWNKAIATTLGYKVFDVKYEEGNYYYDVKQDGLVLGLTWGF